MPAPATTAGSSAIPASATVGALADPLSTFHGDRKPVHLRHKPGRVTLPDVPLIRRL
jgi:hypothetical protein